MKRRRWTDFALVWQAALVLAPALMLPGVAIYFLRQDKAAVEQQAREQASILARELARQLGDRVDEGFWTQSAPLTGVILNGRIQSPPDYPRLPEPPDWPDKLTPTDARLWKAAQEARYQNPNAEVARKALSQLKASGATLDVRVNAEYGLLILESKGATPTHFVRECVDLAHRAEGSQTESGAPVADLALLLAFRHSGTGRAPQSLMDELSNGAFNHPSFLTAELLKEAPNQHPIEVWRAGWEAAETTRALLRMVRERLADPAAPLEMRLWQDGHPYLALCSPMLGGWRVELPTPDQFSQVFRDALRESRMTVPAYAAAAVEMAGGTWSLDGSPVKLGADGKSRDAVLASAPGSLRGFAPPPPGVVPPHLLGAGPLQFTLDLNLANPDLLYGSYRRRMRLVAALMFFATGAAMAALAGLWRNYRRQAALSEMKSNFVSSVSHELRAPIAAVRLMAESLDRGTVAEEDKRKDYFRLIVQECRRLSSLVENVLDFSRIDQGRKQYTFEPVEVAAVARQAVAMMEPCAAEREVRLTFAEPAEGAANLQARWDAHAIEQSLVNLIDNAIKHSPAGAEVKVSIELAGGAAVRIWVEDHGEGIPKEEQARIFDLFYRHGSELRRETQGAGIGLSIVKHVAEAHGGRVIVESALGAGSRFALELPV
jgi:signal transduction histidine kinase